MIRDYLSDKFNKSEITVFGDGEEAIKNIDTEPNVILLDYNLDTRNSKALNGIQVLMQLKKKFKCPVIFLTAQERPDVAANIIKYGAADYVLKDQQSFGKMERSIRQVLELKPRKEKNAGKSFLLVVLGIAIVILVLYLMRY